jgi:hypothetical protein
MYLIREPTWSMVIALADALGVETDAFRQPAGDTKSKRGRPPKRNSAGKPAAKTAKREKAK